MRHKFFSQPFLFLMALILLSTACSKEGPAGATGPAGPAGPQGPAGANGTQGPQGTAGTANVIYSAWLDQTFAFDNVDSVFFTQIAAPKLTAAVLNQGTMKVYWNANTAASPQVVSLPYFDGGLLTGAPLLLNPVFSVGTIEILSNFNVSTVTDPTAGKVFQYRYVLIPGGTAARIGVDLNNYEEVKAHFNIPD